MSSDYSITDALWPDDSALVRRLREIVFVIEQGVDHKIEWDGRDHLCQHVIAYSKAEQPIGTGRILPTGHIGRIAVLPAWRGKGVGGAILEHLITLATQHNVESIYLNSQLHAMDFYRHFGFKAEGLVFMEAGIPHQKMVLISKT